VVVLAVLVAATPVTQAANDKQIKEAIDRGVAYVKSLQRQDGSWPFQESGMTSLAGLTLIECGVPTHDPSIQSAATFVRNAIVTEDRTYSVALAIMFLDRLGEAVDVSLVEALGARLLSGQFADGGWTYRSGTELLGGQKDRLKEAVLRRVDSKDRKAPTTEQRRAPTDISPETKGEIDNIVRRGPIAGANAGGGVGGLNGEIVQRPDNSNTQFAVLGLWTARRYGVPVQDALDRVEKRFRTTQNSDGGWGYMLPTANLNGRPTFDPNASSTSAMTCAGLIGMAMFHAAKGESTLRAGGKGKDGDSTSAPKKSAIRDIARDPAIDAGLKYLGGALASAPATKQPPPMPPRGGVGPGAGQQPPAGAEPTPKGRPGQGGAKGPPREGAPREGAQPKEDVGEPPQKGRPAGVGGRPPDGQFPPGFPGPGGQAPPGFQPPNGQMPRGGFEMPTKNLMAMGRVYYFLWSLERAAVAYGLRKIGDKDWYDWGANFLLGDQEKDGSWQGIHGKYGADTCFALLFLRRADLAKDLSDSLRGQASELRVRPGGLKPGESIKPVRSPFDDGTGNNGGGGAVTRPNQGDGGKPKPPPANVDPIVAKLGTELLDAPAAKWDEVLAKLRDAKGSEHTQGLAYAITQLEGEQKKKARDALAERLAKLKSTFLATYMSDDDPELRRAGAIACALKEDMTHVGKLIELLEDRERTVERAAYWALKELTKQNFGPAANATDAEKSAAVKSWRDWWKKQAEK
jgi:hypothetical protein